VTAIKIGKGDELIAAEIFDPSTAGHAIIASERGWIKRVPMGEWPVQGRAGKGVQSLRITDSTGTIAAAAVARRDDNYVDFVTGDGYRLRFRYDVLPEVTRPARGEHAPDLLRRQEKKDRTTMKDIGRIVSATALSATYTYRAS